ncbi:protein of unknown function DUF4033 [Cynara cardunculus var. scolymus]|uniref:Beta-carotene isomerase D27-like C-terminal domain-containing protein n=1 Tax=Cynara cardunculus var. scolymus TaxID=59895 RepID=A0A103YP00_CYNCS|nr:protein of unknown function DUF4033 [Cynara cardunculus var. scolymus]
MINIKEVKAQLKSWSRDVENQEEKKKERRQTVVDRDIELDIDIDIGIAISIEEESMIDRTGVNSNGERENITNEVGWDSEKPGYDGLIDVANRLMLARTNSQTQEAAVRILRSLFPPLLLELYKILIAPIAQGKLAALMVARVTALSCQWLMGSCTVNSVDGSSLPTGVFVERCKYLEESKCVGICINTCKLPTQEFFMDYMGVPLLMEPNFNDYSCQFKFGVLPPQQDATLKEPCLEVCPHKNEIKCPKA